MACLHCAFKIALDRRRSTRCVGVFLCLRVRAAPWQATMALGQPRDRPAAHAKDRTTRQNSAGRNEPDRAPFSREDRGARRYRTRTRKAKRKNEKGTRARSARVRESSGACSLTVRTSLYTCRHAKRPRSLMKNAR